MVPHIPKYLVIVTTRVVRPAVGVAYEFNNQHTPDVARAGETSEAPVAPIARGDDKGIVLVLNSVINHKVPVKIVLATLDPVAGSPVISTSVLSHSNGTDFDALTQVDLYPLADLVGARGPAGDFVPVNGTVGVVGGVSAASGSSCTERR
ncbi:MAG TPA: hypothetical protein V6C97_27115 [Oculatellaceae cyanobacterium]